MIIDNIDSLFQMISKPFNGTLLFNLKLAKALLSVSFPFIFNFSGNLKVIINQ